MHNSHTSNNSNRQVISFLIALYDQLEAHDRNLTIHAGIATFYYSYNHRVGRLYK